MEDRRTRLPALVGTIALHVAVVVWLALTPVQQARVLDAVSMDVVDLTPEEEVVEPPPPPEKAPPEPPPEPDERPVKRTRRVERQQEETPPEEAPPETPPEPASAPRTFDFGMQSLASPGSGATFGMARTEGTSALGSYAPGRRGGSGGPASTKAPPEPVRRPDFAPVPASRLSRDPEPLQRGAPPYPAEARRQYIEGPVRLLVEIRSNGRVRNVRVISEPGGGLGDAAVAFVRRMQFRPALDQRGRPVDARITYTVRFLLDD